MDITDHVENDVESDTGEEVSESADDDVISGSDGDVGNGLHDDVETFSEDAEELSTSCTTTGTCTNRLVQRNVFRFGDLPTELQDQILDDLLVFHEPIELAPTDFYQDVKLEDHLSSSQYRHAVRFQSHI